MTIHEKYLKARKVIESAETYKQFITAYNYCNLLIGLPGHYHSFEAKILSQLMKEKRSMILQYNG